ncbi:Acyltransferase family protein [Babesia bovis T2Bo]|uniref:Acyltransferase family protein n=1 Tax=Babesia bovis T2Bo TaxID=484906 RepID=UPI001DDB7614|nr:Acyltransferase family protein [Babesia bovis T2Bo]EDO05751.2 Acyltransferase family protein [Babesia bovis T2Bo]
MMVASEEEGSSLRQRPLLGRRQGDISDERPVEFDFDVLRVKSRPGWLKRWNHIIVGFIWTYLHFRLTYNVTRHWQESYSIMSFIRHHYISLSYVATYWMLLITSVYSVFHYDQCVRFHVKNFDKFPDMYEDHANQAALMHADLKNYSIYLQLFGALFLAPLRIVGGMLFFVAAMLFIGIPLTVLCGHFKTRSRQYAAFVFYYLTIYAFWGLGIYEVKTVYAEGVDREKPMNVISNHIGIVDVVYMLHSGSFSFVCKKSLENAFIIGHFIKLLNCIVVDRHSAQNRKEVFWNIVERMQSIDQGKEPISLMVYPEGTTSRGNILLPFKHGSFGALVPLQPMLVVLDYTYLNITFDAFPWKWWVFHTFCSPITTAFIAYWLPTIYPPGKEEIAIKGEQTCIREYALYANRVMREAILKLNPNVDRAYLQQRDVVVSPTLRQKLLARLYGPLLQKQYRITDAEMRKTDEVVFQ